MTDILLSGCGIKNVQRSTCSRGDHSRLSVVLIHNTAADANAKKGHNHCRSEYCCEIGEKGMSFWSFCLVGEEGSWAEVPKCHIMLSGVV